MGRVIMSGHESMATFESVEQFVAHAAEVVAGLVASLASCSHDVWESASELLQDGLADAGAAQVPAPEQLLALRSALVRTRRVWEQCADEADVAAAHRVLMRAKTMAIEAT